MKITRRENIFLTLFGLPSLAVADTISRQAGKGTLPFPPQYQAQVEKLKERYAAVQAAANQILGFYRNDQEGLKNYIQSMSRPLRGGSPYLPVPREISAAAFTPYIGACLAAADIQTNPGSALYGANADRNQALIATLASGGLTNFFSNMVGPTTGIKISDPQNLSLFPPGPINNLVADGLNDAILDLGQAVNCSFNNSDVFFLSITQGRLSNVAFQGSNIGPMLVSDSQIVNLDVRGSAFSTPLSLTNTNIEGSSLFNISMPQGMIGLGFDVGSTDFTGAQIGGIVNLDSIQRVFSDSAFIACAIPFDKMQGPLIILRSDVVIGTGLPNDYLAQARAESSITDIGTFVQQFGSITPSYFTSNVGPSPMTLRIVAEHIAFDPAVQKGIAASGEPFSDQNIKDIQNAIPYFDDRFATYTYKAAAEERASPRTSTTARAALGPSYNPG